MIIRYILFLLLFSFCTACNNNIYKEEKLTQKEKVIIGKTDENIIIEENAKNIANNKYNEGEVLVIIKKGYGDVLKSENKLLKNAKIIFSFSDDAEKEAIVLVKNKNYTTKELIKELKDLPEVISVEPNYDLNEIHIE